jgi:23S rRNA (cytidine1920-2'-O)/16S rRNA (cytidine1409-2'-O)-methyltransferase
VRRGLSPSRVRARADIESGRVRVGGSIADKPSRRVAPDDAIEVTGDGPRFASRGGDKLDAALDRFGVDVDGRRCIDVGASTGGFTDCLLQRGAAHVVAVDVGHGQLHPDLAFDARVTSRERTDIRDLDDVEPADVVVADLSFISLTAVAARLLEITREGGDLVVLVKPQFEVGRAEVHRGRGVVRDPSAREQAVERVRAAFVGQDAHVIGVMVSPLTGSSGNVEYLAHVRPGKRA